MTDKPEKRMLVASMLLLVGEFTALTLALIIPWKVNLIPYLGCVVIQQISGTSTEVFFCTPPQPLIIIIVAAYGSTASPITWPLIPSYMGAKIILLGKTKFSESRAATFVPLIYLVDRYMSFPWPLNLFAPTIFTQGGLGVYSLLLGLLLGAFGTNYFVSAIMNPAIVAVWTKLNEEGEASLEETAKTMKLTRKLLYELLSEAAVQGILAAVVTAEKAYPINSDKGKEIIASLFADALSVEGEVKITRARRLMKKYGVWFTKNKEAIRRILLEAIEKGEIKAEIEGNTLKKATAEEPDS